MLLRTLPVLLLVPSTRASPRARNASDVCAQIADQISSTSGVFYPLSVQYAQDIKHWADSSTQQSACSVEPSTPEDLSTVVKGGGHTTNVGFSSTTGVQIAMSRFDKVTLSADKSTVDVGAGLIWDDVYSALDGSGVNVVGGRVPGVGVAGFTLGGGYSWKTSQYGLTIDNIAAYELVLPNGTITTVTATDEDLWFALRGIVTKFTLVTHLQTDVWGGLVTITASQFDKLNKAVADFSANSTDKKAAILPTYNSIVTQPGMSLIVFYDGPTPPDGLFDELLAVPHFTNDAKTRSFADLVGSIPSNNPLEGHRAAFTSVSVLQYTPAILQLVTNMTIEWGARLALTDASPFISFDIEPFDPSLFSYGAPSAYPPDRSRGLMPTNLYFSWQSDKSDDFIIGVMKNLADDIRAAAVAESQDVEDAFIYGNYAPSDTPLVDVYGSNVDRLRQIRATVDPGDVMGLAGGFRF
ncbi:FAD-binding domain-containing protein [Vararia minispora EC-137]|uniref:FAD-binding domain-containing protein n=1 Tax=Vararia minispora EC-137 TaxID=1314806 RepID=A0ACB8QFV9_9AGAM|nr:FAD-binding domain-containing protein [Vararia minispora EC-137]